MTILSAIFCGIWVLATLIGFFLWLVSTTRTLVFPDHPKAVTFREWCVMTLAQSYLIVGWIVMAHAGILK
jgi:uncharacterized membrane protein